MTFGKRLQALRNSLGLSQEALAEKLNVSEADIVNFENEKTMPSADILVQISGIFSISIDELLGNEPAEEKPKPFSGGKILSDKKKIRQAKSGEYRSTIAALSAVTLIFVIESIILNITENGLSNEPNSNPVMFWFYVIILLAIISGFIIKKTISIKNTVNKFIGNSVPVYFYPDCLTTGVDENNSKKYNYKDFKSIIETDYYFDFIMRDGTSFCVEKRALDGYPDSISDFAMSNKKYKNKCIVNNSKSTNISHSGLFILKNIDILLFVISIASIFFLLSTIAIINLSNIPQHIIFFPLVFPCLTLAFGIILKIKNFRGVKLIVSGIIMSFLILIYSYMFFTSYNNMIIGPETSAEKSSAFANYETRRSMEVEDITNERYENYLEKAYLVKPQNGAYEILYLGFDEYGGYGQSSAEEFYESQKENIFENSAFEYDKQYNETNSFGYYTFYTENQYIYLYHNGGEVIAVCADVEYMEEIQSKLGKYLVCKTKRVTNHIN